MITIHQHVQFTGGTPEETHRGTIDVISDSFSHRGAVIPSPLFLWLWRVRGVSPVGSGFHEASSR